MFRTTMTFPIINMVASVDAAINTGPLAAPIIQVLPKSLGTLNRRLVLLQMLPEGIGMVVTAYVIYMRKRSTVRYHRTHLTDVILDQRAGRPPVDAEVVETTDRSAIVAYVTNRSGIPAFTANGIADTGPVNCVVASELSGVGKGNG